MAPGVDAKESAAPLPSAHRTEAPAASPPAWDDNAPYVDLPKSLIPTLGVAGLEDDDSISPEAVALCDLTSSEQEEVRRLYAAMKERFARLEVAHFERATSGKQSFILCAFPEDAMALQREWAEELNALLGETRGQFLDLLIRAPVTPSLHWKRRQARIDGRMGPPIDEIHLDWLHSGMAEVRLEISNSSGGTSGGLSANLKFYSSTDKNLTGGSRGHIPERWRHLLTAEILGAP